MSDPRVLHLTVCARGGGTEKHVRRLCERVAWFEHAALQDLMGAPLQWSRLPQAAKVLRARRPDVVFCYGASAHLAAALAWPIGGPALVGNVRGEIDFAGAKGALRAVLAPRFRFWIGNSRAVTPRGGRTIYNGVEIPAEDERPAFANLRRPVLGLVANESPVKGHRFMLQLWDELGRPGSLVFAGALGDALRRDAESMGVACPGYVAPGPTMRSLDLLVAPSTTESIPTVLLEAMARGVPCLATPVGGVGELIEHGRTGFVLPREKWAEFLKNLDAVDLAGVAERGREYAMREFSFERTVELFAAAAREAAE